MYGYFMFILQNILSSLIIIDLIKIVLVTNFEILVVSGFTLHHYVGWLVEGLFVLIASFLLILKSDNIRDLLLNFSVISFLSTFNSFAFTIAMACLVGQRIAKDSIKFKRPHTKRILNGQNEDQSTNQFLLHLFSFCYFSVDYK